MSVSSHIHKLLCERDEIRSVTKRASLYFQFKTHFTSGANLRVAGGPVSKTFSAVSENPSDGIFAFSHTACEVAT